MGKPIVTRKGILRRRLRLDRARARAAINEALADREFDRREIERIVSAHAAGKVEERKERGDRRVRALISRDRMDRLAEEARQAAEQASGEGKEISLSEVALGPTTEQIQRAGRYGFEQVGEVGTGKSARLGAIVYRRRSCPVAWKMLMQGVIDRTGFDACCWYRGIFEATGLQGSIASTDYSREVFSAPNARAMFADWQVEQQDQFRAIRKEIDANLLRMLDAMVLNDVSVHRAARVARTGHREPKACFERAVEQLCDVRSRLERKS